MPELFDTLFNLCLILAVCAGVAMVILEIRRARSIRTWPRTSGRVTAARVTTMDGYAGAAFGCEVDYEYTVDGSTYAGSGQLIGFQTPDRARAQELCEKYRAGDELLIAYSPTNVSRSLMAGATINEIGIGAVLGGVVIATLALVWLVIRVH